MSRNLNKLKENDSSELIRNISDFKNKLSDFLIEKLIYSKVNSKEYNFNNKPLQCSSLYERYCDFLSKEISLGYMIHNNIESELRELINQADWQEFYSLISFTGEIIKDCEKRYFFYKRWTVNTGVDLTLGNLTIEEKEQTIKARQEWWLDQFSFNSYLQQINKILLNTRWRFNEDCRLELEGSKADLEASNLSSRKESIIIIVEDSDAEYELFEMALSRSLNKNYNLLRFSNGERFINYLDEQVSNDFAKLIFLDLNMPRKTGHDCLEDIKQKHIKIPTVVLTNSIAQEDIDKAFNLGANAYLKKKSKLEETITDIKAIDKLWLVNL